MLWGLCIAMFVALVGWGPTYFGWSDPDGKIQLAIKASKIGVKLKIESSWKV